MNEEDLLSTLLATSYTATDLRRRFRLLREYIEQKYFVTGTLTLNDYFTSHSISKIDADILSGWGNNFYQSITARNAVDLMANLEKRIEETPVVAVYLPFDPAPVDTTRLGDWFRTTLERVVLLEIHLDTAMVGGFAFAWNGVYHQYSLSYFMKKKREEIITIITNYAGKLQ